MYIHMKYIHSIYFENLGVTKQFLLRTKPTVCQLRIFILTAGNLMAAAFTSAVMSTPSGALQHNTYHLS